MKVLVKSLMYINVTINLVLLTHSSAQLLKHAPNLVKFFAQITLVPILNLTVELQSHVHLQR
jgi:hypothetical protein